MPGPLMPGPLMPGPLTPEPAPPPAATAENPTGPSPYVLLCEHAANLVPPHYARLGLPEPELQRHIAWDIGAARLARLIAHGLDAPLFLSGYSRLLIDCNRPPGTPTSIPERSENTPIPGNAALPPEERRQREALYFAPLQRMVGAELDRRARHRIPTIVLGVHSFTPVFGGVARPWLAGVLYAGAATFATALLHHLASHPGLDLDTTLGDNEPYRIEPEHDYTVPIHGDARGIPAALLEIRNDQLTDAAGTELWATRLIPALKALEPHARPPANT